jgi:hypothetical protein
MKFTRSVPVPEYDTGTIVEIGSYETGAARYSVPEKFGRIEAITITWRDLHAPRVEYFILGSWYPVEAIKSELRASAEAANE